MGEENSVRTRNGTEVVFENLRSRLESDDAARSLWQKLEQEMAIGGTAKAGSYLRSRFSELSTRIKVELDRLAGS